MEGDVPHYFHGLPAFMQRMAALLKPDGQMICSDFHPLQKIMDVLEKAAAPMDYFSAEVVEREMAHARFYPLELLENFSKCSLRRCTISEIINALLDAGFLLRRFDEHPVWTDSRLPGEFARLVDKA